MTRKEHTIIFVPHARARFRQFRVSSRVLYGVASLVVLSAVLGATFSVLWLQSYRRNREVVAILGENRDLRNRASVLNTRLEAIEKQMTEFEERTRRLSIVAGLSASHDAGSGGVGGLSAMPVDSPDGAERSLSAAANRGALLSSRLGDVEKRLALQADQLALTPTVAPALGVLTAGFGQRIDPFTGDQEFHTGIDISTQTGNRVFAPANGTVVKVGWENGYGRVVRVAHGFGVSTLYGHLEAAKVAEGQRLKRGELVGLVGSSGRSTGPHLHYEVYVNGKAVNPLDYVLNAF